MQVLKKIFKFDDWSPNMRLLAAATFLMSMSMALKDTSFTNFANDIGVTAGQFSFIESIREIPGLLTVLMAMVTYFITESILASLSLFTVGIGMLIFSASSDFVWICTASVVYSIGFHLFYPLQESMALKMGSKDEGGKLLGRLGSIASTASLIGMGSVIFLSRVASPRIIFALAAIAGVLAGVVLLKMPKPNEHLKPKTLLWKKKYKYYYILTFLSGCRRHIFTVFAPLVLVKVYNVELTTMAALMTVNQLLNIYTKQKIGKLIDTMGEKLALTLNFGILIFVFVGYAYVKWLPILFFLYILDNVCFGFNMSISTYLNKICPSEDLAPSLTMGTTVNHIAAVFIPIIGGLLWESHGYQFSFILGAIIVAISLLVVYSMKDIHFKHGNVKHIA